MSNVVIPKEELTAFQRWELASFDHPSKTRAATREEIELATVAELENIRQQAYNEGFEQGQTAGYAAGIQQANEEIGQLRILTQDFQVALNQIDAQLAQSLLDLSLEVARKMVGETLKINPEFILDVVTQAIGSLPHFNQHGHLILHPEDAELVRKHMGDHLAHTGWRILTDAGLRRGGCRIETAHTKIDATIEARWKRIVESIGQDKSWLP
ncbi:MAG TPA: flagellar assembly protein FliH [Gallionella sp.]|nr:flagellar assembly protein FliH [Gallionella sp.]